MVYMSEHYTTELRAMIARQAPRTAAHYPIAAALINVSHELSTLLLLAPNGICIG
jgi:hypothetical protein